MKNFSYSGDGLDGLDILDILDVLEGLDGVRYVSGAWVLQRSETVAPTRGLRWPIVLMGFGTVSGETPWRLKIGTVTRMFRRTETYI